MYLFTIKCNMTLTRPTLYRKQNASMHLLLCSRRGFAILNNYLKGQNPMYWIFVLSKFSGNK